MTKLGPTGDFPQGQSGPDDLGGIQIAVGRDANGDVRIDFGAGSAVDWIAFPPEQATELAMTILKHAGAKVVVRKKPK